MAQVFVSGNVSSSAFAQYCESKGVRGVGGYIDDELYAMMTAVVGESKGSMTRGVRLAIASLVNNAGLTRELPLAEGVEGPREIVPWTYDVSKLEPTRKLTLKEENAKLKAEIEALKAASQA